MVLDDNFCLIIIKNDLNLESFVKSGVYNLLGAWKREIEIEAFENTSGSCACRR